MKNVDTELVPISELNFDARNARKHGEINLNAVKGSLEEFGQQKPIVVVRDGMKVIAGNGTLEAAKMLGWDEISVTFTDLDEVRAKAYALADNRTSELAEWDMGILAEQLSELVDEGFDIDSIGFDDIDDIDSGGGNSKSGDYTKKIQAPIYEIKGEKPDVDDLYDDDKTRSLKAKIEEADISDEEKTFLLRAAERHTVFRYDSIAEYYAAASDEVKGLMEESALVIIDFDKAIELGYVKLSEDLAEAYRENSNDGTDDDQRL